MNFIVTIPDKGTRGQAPHTKGTKKDTGIQKSDQEKLQRKAGTAVCGPGSTCRKSMQNRIYPLGLVIV